MTRNSIDLDGVGGIANLHLLDPIGMEQLRELTIIEAQYLHDIVEGHRTIGDIW